MDIKRISLFLLIVGLFTACSDSIVPTIAPEVQTEEEIVEEERNVTINISNTHQTIESFAASDCWLPNFIGTYWDEDCKEGIAKLLFSGEIVGGQPEGIGLSGWRFNLGGGTANQGDNSGISDVSRRAESFMSPTDGTLDWTKQAGQQYFLQKAKEYGMTEQFIMFCNTPPVYLTRNGLGYNKNNPINPWRANISEENYSAFASYIAQSLEYLRDNLGIDFEYLSPANEPQYNWDSEDQEGTPYQDYELSALVKKIDEALTDKTLNTKIMITEAADYNYLFSQNGDNDRGNQIIDFFDATSSNYIGNLNNIGNVIAGHSYWSDGNWEDLISTRKKLSEAALAKGLKVYQTEWSMLENNGHYSSDEFVGFDSFTEMDIALYMAKVIHCDLTYAGVSSWSFWTSVDLDRWDHNNRFLLIKAYPSGGVYGDVTSGGTFESAKTLWALGNYSRFVRPGYKRIDLEIADYSKEIFGDAFVSEDGKTVVAVYTNLSSANYDIKATMNNATVTSTKTYTTSKNSNLKEGTIETNASIIVQPQSVVTVVYQLQ